MTFAKGCRPSAPHKLAARLDLREHPAVKARLAAHYEGRVALPESVDLLPYEPPVFDQGSTSSCTAAATTAGVAVALAAAGSPLGFVPSQRELYAVTRAMERALAAPPGQPLPALTDSGAELADVYAALARYGVRPMLEQRTSDGRFYDVEIDHVNDEPSFADLEASINRPIVGPYGIDPTDPNAGDTMAAALASGIPIGTAGFVDTAFEQLSAEQIAGAPNLADPGGGGHALLVPGYRMVNGARQWKVRNSWGAWCLGGYCWASEAWRTALWEAHPIAAKLGAP